MWLRTAFFRLRRWLRPAVPAPKPVRRVRPRVECLETREVPAVTLLNEVYTASLIQGFLGRSAGPTDLVYWNSQFAAGATPLQVADEIVASPEFQGRELQLLYPAYLGRPLDQSGLTAFGPVLRSGGGVDQVIAGILGSQEFFLDNGGNITTWLNSVYQSQLGRALDNAGAAFWTAQLGAGQSRQQVVAEIIASPEADLLKVRDIYEEILARPLDSAGAVFWQSVLLSGQPVENVFTGVVGSAEYVNDLAASLATSGLTDPNQAANQFLTAGPRFNQQLPGLVVVDRLLPTNTAINTVTDQIPGSTVATTPTTSTLPTTVTTPATTGVSGTSAFTPGLASLDSPVGAGAGSPFASGVTAVAGAGSTVDSPVGTGAGATFASGIAAVAGAGSTIDSPVGTGAGVPFGSGIAAVAGAGNTVDSPVGAGAGSTFATSTGAGLSTGLIVV